MKIKLYIEKLERDKRYAEFNKKYPDSFIIAGFFVLDFEQGQNVHQIDFYIPSQKKVAAFTLDQQISIQLLDIPNEKPPEKLDVRTNIDLDILKGIITDEMRNRGMTEEIKKMIAVIQNIKGRKIWNVNCVISGMEILKAHIEDKSETILKMEKVSLMDIMKKIPRGAMPSQQPQNPKEALGQLEKMEEKIEEQKARLKKELQKEHGGEKVKSAKPEEEQIEEAVSNEFQSLD